MKPTMLSMALVAALSAPLLLSGVTSVAHAEDIGFARAEQIALEHVKGKVTDIERERKLGKDVFEVEIRTPEGVKMEVLVDANDGTVLGVEQDD